MTPVVEILLVVLIAIGTFFVLVGSFGLAKLSEFFKRLHGPTKASTLGVGCILIASIGVHALRDDGLGLREMLVTLFLFLTAPISAHLMARAALRLVPQQRPAQPPPAQVSLSEAGDLDAVARADRHDDAPPR